MFKVHNLKLTNFVTIFFLETINLMKSFTKTSSIMDRVNVTCTALTRLGIILLVGFLISTIALAQPIPKLLQVNALTEKVTIQNFGTVTVDISTYWFCSFDWGEISTIELPDKSVVKLNAGSKLIYYPDEWDKTRSLELQGEALFQVENGSTFKVLTELGKVQVLGTVFNVYAREKKFTVACQSGLVSVTNFDGDLSREIGAGQLAVMEKNQIQVTKIANPIQIGSWQNGDFYFSRTPLSEVFGELERQFNVTIEFDTSQKTTYTGYFSNKDLDKALTNVCIPLGLEYSLKQKEGKVIIKQGGQR